MKIGSTGNLNSIALEQSQLKQQQTQFKVNVNSISGGSDQVSLSGRSTSGASLAASTAKGDADIAADAATKIVGLREEQLALAEQAVDLNDEESRGELTDQINTLEAEISRVATEAVDANGNSLLGGASLSIGDENEVVLADLSELVQTAEVSSIASDLSSSGLESSVTSLENIVDTARQLSTAASAVQTKATSTLSDITEVESSSRSQDGSAIQSIEEAQQVANQISTEVVSRFSESGDANAVLVNSTLDPEKVNQLTEEERN